MPLSCPPTSFAPVSIRVGMVLFPCLLRACHSEFVPKRAVPQYLSCIICVRICNEHLVCLIKFECSLYSRTGVCNRMIPRTIHIPGTSFKSHKFSFAPRSRKREARATRTSAKRGQLTTLVGPDAASLSSSRARRQMGGS